VEPRTLPLPVCTVVTYEWRCCEDCSTLAATDGGAEFVQGQEEKKRKTTQAAKHSLHQLRKRRHIGPKCRESPPPKEKKTSGDLEGGWQPPAPDRDLESS